jgi:hypothetical protein
LNVNLCACLRMQIIGTLGGYVQVSCLLRTAFGWPSHLSIMCRFSQKTEDIPRFSILGSQINK